MGTLSVETPTKRTRLRLPDFDRREIAARGRQPALEPRDLCRRRAPAVVRVRRHAADRQPRAQQLRLQVVRAEMEQNTALRAPEMRSARQNSQIECCPAQIQVLARHWALVAGTPRRRTRWKLAADAALKPLSVDSGGGGHDCRGSAWLDLAAVAGAAASAVAALLVALTDRSTVSGASAQVCGPCAGVCAGSAVCCRETAERPAVASRAAAVDASHALLPRWAPLPTSAPVAVAVPTPEAATVEHLKSACA